ncbi:max-like protein, partial [Euroglyphus maynei]
DDESQYIQGGSNLAGGGGGSGSDSGRNNIPSAADRRAHHNALERKRRDHIKDSFSSLRDSVPSLHGEKASRAQILKKAAEYIQFMRKKNTNIATDIEEIKKQNKMLEDQIHKFEKRGLALSPTPSSASSTPTQTLISPNNNSNSLYSTGVQSLLSIGAGAVSESSPNGVTSPTISYGDLSENSNESNVTNNSDLNLSMNGIITGNGGNSLLTDSPISPTVVTMNSSTALVQRQQIGGRHATPSVQPLTTQQAQLLINGSTSGPTVRSVVKNGSNTIIVQNPQIKSTANSVIHVSANNNNNSNTATATPIIISTTSLANTSGSIGANGNATYTVLNTKTSGVPSGTALSLASTTATTNGAYRTVVVQPASAATLATQSSLSGGGGGGTTTPNIHIVSTIPTTYSGRVVGANAGATKRFKISTTTTGPAAASGDSIVEMNNKKNNSTSSLSNNTSSGSTNGKTFNITSVSS